MHLRANELHLRRKRSPGFRRGRPPRPAVMKVISSEPAVPTETCIERNDRYGDQADDGKVAVLPLEFGHILEVHAVDTGDRRGHGEDSGPRREAPRDVV